MNDITIVFIYAIVGMFLIVSFLLGRMQGRHKERIFLLETVRNLHSEKIDKIAIIDTLERKWHK